MLTGAECVRFLYKRRVIVIVPNNNPKKPKGTQRELINEKVRFPSVRLIGPTGEQLGVMSSREAQIKANEYELDLVCISPNAEPPVCKLLNYGKYRFEQQKRAKEAKKNQRIIEVKEIQLTPQIGAHDMETKARAAMKFLSEGNKVKVGVRFRGRQMTHIEVGQEVMDNFIALLADYAVVEKAPAMEGKWMYAILAPKRK